MLDDEKEQKRNLYRNLKVEKSRMLEEQMLESFSHQRLGTSG